MVRNRIGLIYRSTYAKNQSWQLHSGVEKLVSRQAHNLKNTGSNPVSATNYCTAQSCVAFGRLRQRQRSIYAFVKFPNKYQFTLGLKNRKLISEVRIFSVRPNIYFPRKEFITILQQIVQVENVSVEACYILTNVSFKGKTATQVCRYTCERNLKCQIETASRKEGESPSSNANY